MAYSSSAAAATALDFPYAFHSSPEDLLSTDTPLHSLRSISAPPPTGRIAKRRPRRPSKRSPTTFIATDTANFRDMVQQITGIRDPTSPAGVGYWEEASPVVRPQPRKATTLEYLPTLDTSAFLLDQEADRAGGFRAVDEIACFPTLESWGLV